MATKRKSKRKTKTKTKKDLEAKIAELEGKLSQISSQLGQKQAEQAKAAPPPPPPKPKPAEAPKPAPKEQAAPPATLESLYATVPTGNWHTQKTKTTGYVPENARAWARRHAEGADAPTHPWSLQKSKVPGYTAVSDKYFATRQRLAFHPHQPDKNFQGYGISLGHGQAQAKAAPPPPPPPPPPQEQATPKETSRRGSAKKQDLEAYEQDYLARLEQQERENAEIQRAAEELAAKKAESGGSSQAGSKRGSLPKGF